MFKERESLEAVSVLARSKAGIYLGSGTEHEIRTLKNEDLHNLLDDAYESGVAQADHTGVAKEPFLIDKVAGRIIQRHLQKEIPAGTELEIAGGTLKEMLLDAYCIGDKNSYSADHALDGIKGDLAACIINAEKLNTSKLKPETLIALQHLTAAYDLSASGQPDAHSLAVQHVEVAKNLVEDSFAAKGPAANHISHSITAILAKDDSAYVLRKLAHEVDGKVLPLDTKPSLKEVRDFVGQVVQAYSQVFDDPTAGGKAVDDGVAVPAIAVPKQKPNTTAELEAVKQVQKAYEATMAVADLLEAGKEDEALKQYTVARKEATKAFHALTKCPEYRPEAREALGKALKPHERDLPVGNGDRGQQR
jgi:hypothetical protein